ncbi:hypothetical protein ASE38_17335 [Cellulomonas sp. Root930]|nr:hypothetical protein ASE38_17335 [Cellulomonas sp. Root930]
MVRAVRRHRSGGLETTATDQRHPGDAFGSALGLAAPDLVEVDPGGTPVRIPATFAVLRPCRTRRTVAMPWSLGRLPGTYPVVADVDTVRP